MSGHFVTIESRRHCRCDLPSAAPDGAVWECDCCGRQWKAHTERYGSTFWRRKWRRVQARPESLWSPGEWPIGS